MIFSTKRILARFPLSVAVKGANRRRYLTGKTKVKELKTYSDFVAKKLKLRRVRSLDSSVGSCTELLEI
jgi:hypothetical protein